MSLLFLFRYIPPYYLLFHLSFTYLYLSCFKLSETILSNDARSSFQKIIESCQYLINDNIKLNFREIRRITVHNCFVRYCFRIKLGVLRSSFIRVFRQYPLFIPYREMSFRMSGMGAACLREGECNVNGIRRGWVRVLENAYLVCRNRFANWRALEKKPEAGIMSGSIEGKGRLKRQHTFRPLRSSIFSTRFTSPSWIVFRVAVSLSFSHKTHVFMRTHARAH